MQYVFTSRRDFESLQRPESVPFRKITLNPRFQLCQFKNPIFINDVVTK